MGGWENPTFFERVIEVPAVNLTAVANTVVYNPGTSVDYLIKLWFCLVNPDVNTRVVTVGIDYAATGALTHYCFNEIVRPMGRTGWIGPFTITANDDIMAWQDAGTDIDMHFGVLQPLQYAVGGP